MNRLYLDLETTKLDETGSIIEIAAEYYKDYKKVTAYHSKCFADNSFINLDALKVNRYKLSDLKSFKSEKEALINFFDWLLSLEVKLELAGINIHFDYNFLKNRAKLYNIEIGSVLPYKLHDIANIARFLNSIGLIKVEYSGSCNTLKDLAVALGLKIEENKLHTAEYDTSLYPLIDFKLEELVKQYIDK